jgi:hypothetical protein
VDSDFSSFKEKCKLLSKPTKHHNKSCTSLKDQINGVFTKIQSPFLIIYEFSKVAMKKTQQDTIMDSSLWASLLKKGSFWWEARDVHKGSWFFLLYLSAMRIHYDDQGLRYACPSDLVQLRHISGQLNVFSLSQEYFCPLERQT